MYQPALYGITAEVVYLYCGPFTDADASAQIAAAIESVEERLRAQKRAATLGRPALYRFFVTNGLPGGSTHQ